MAKDKRKPKRKSNRKSKPLKKEAGKIGRPVAAVADWKPAFLQAVAEGLHVTDAAATACIDVTMPYKTRNSDEVFRLAWAAATKVGTKTLESEASRRAYHGTLKPVFQGGVLVGRIREYSDILLMFLLKGRLPRKYRESIKHSHGGDADAPPIGTDVTSGGKSLGADSAAHLNSELAALIVALAQRGGEDALNGDAEDGTERRDDDAGGAVETVPS